MSARWEVARVLEDPEIYCEFDGLALSAELPTLALPAAHSNHTNTDNHDKPPQICLPTFTIDPCLRSWPSCDLANNQSPFVAVNFSAAPSST